RDRREGRVALTEIDLDTRRRRLRDPGIRTVQPPVCRRSDGEHKEHPDCRDETLACVRPRRREATTNERLRTRDPRCAGAALRRHAIAGAAALDVPWPAAGSLTSGVIVANRRRDTTALDLTGIISQRLAVEMTVVRLP